MWDKVEFLARLDRAVKTGNTNEAAVSRAAGFAAGLIRDWRRKPKVEPKLPNVEALAEALQVAPEWLAFGVGTPWRGVPLAGTVSAGRWIEPALETPP